MIRHDAERSAGTMEQRAIPRRDWLIAVGLAAFGFVGALDQNVIVTALSRMLGDTNVQIVAFSPTGAPSIQIDRAGWLVTGYLLGYVAVLPLMGAVSDAYGRRQVMLAALGVFAVGSVAVALAQSLTVLVLARTVQALGGGALLPVALAAAADVVAPWRQGLALGIIAAAAELGGVCGPIYGAVITQHTGLSWRLIFWLNLPIVVLLAGLAMRMSPRRAAQSVDYRGGLVLGGALAALAVGTSSSGIFGTGAGGGDANRVFLVLCVALLVVLWQVERRAASPLIPGAIVRDMRFAAACAVNALIGVALSVTMVAIPLYAATVLAAPPVQGGLLLLRYLIFLVAGAVLGGWFRDRIGSRAVAVAGLILAALGCWLLRDWLAAPPRSPQWLAPALAGLGTGLVAAPVTTSALSVAEHERGGALASLVTAARVAGMMAGLSAVVSWGSWRFGQFASGLRMRVPAHSSFKDLQHIADAFGILLQGRELTVLREIFVALAVVLAVAILPAALLGDMNVGER